MASRWRDERDVGMKGECREDGGMGAEEHKRDGRAVRFYLKIK